jgi:hypothetical protein
VRSVLPSGRKDSSTAYVSYNSSLRVTFGSLVNITRWGDAISPSVERGGAEREGEGRVAMKQSSVGFRGFVRG